MRAILMGAHRAAHRRLLQLASGLLAVVMFTIAAAPASVAAEKRAADDIWTRDTLTGDWGGLRSRLEDKGIAFKLEYTHELLANVRGGIRRGSIYEGLIQPEMNIDLEKLLGWNGARFSAVGAITHGPPFSPYYLGNLLSASTIEVQRPITRLFELWYEQNAPNDWLSVRAGLLRADTEFLTSEPAFSYINGSFGWMAWLANALPAGGPAYPFSAPGARVRVKPADEVYLQAAVFSGDPSGGDGSNLGGELPTGTVISFRGGTLLIAEMGYTPNIIGYFTPNVRKGAGLPGAYKIGAWYHSSRRFGDQRLDDTGLSLADPMSTGIPLDHTGNWGIYGVVNQMLYSVPGTDDQGLWAFVRIGGSPNDRNLISFYVDAGIGFKGPFGRPDDKVGIGVGYARIGDNARALDQDTAFFTESPYPVRSNETMIELTYAAKLTPWWMLQPDLQYIIRPERRRAQRRRNLPAERMGGRAALGAEFLTGLLGPVSPSSRR